METNFSNGKELTQDLKNAGRKAYDRAVDKTQAVVSNFNPRTGEMTQDLAKNAEAYFDTAQQTVSDAASTTVKYAKAHPIQTALGAAAIGFLAGIALRRKN